MSGIIGGAGSKSGVIGETELDYEYGDFTPIVTAGGTQMSTGGGASIIGYYVKIGRTATLSMKLWSIPVGTSSGAILVTNMPFAPAKDVIFTCRQDYYASAYNPQPIFYLPASQTDIIMYDVGSNETWLDDYEVSDLTNYLFAILSGTFITS